MEAVVTPDKIKEDNGILTLTVPDTRMSDSRKFDRSTPQYHEEGGMVYVPPRWRDLVLKARDEQRRLRVRYDIGAEEEVSNIELL